MNFIPLNKDKILTLTNELNRLQRLFFEKYNVDDIYSNSKIFEIIVADKLNHLLIPGHSGSRDAWDENKNEIEYKHYKETSGNHTWTFNDFSDSTIEKLKTTYKVIFAHIEDRDGNFDFDWYYEVSGKEMSVFLSEATKRIKNKRKMINISTRMLENINSKKISTKNHISNSIYTEDLQSIITTIKNLELESNVKNLLTSNKIWELLTAIHLNHNVNSEQGGRAGAHDAFDELNNQFEYKISKAKSWNFQDISENVLTKYEKLKSFILATKNVKEIKIDTVYEVDKQVIKRIKEKLQAKMDKNNGNLRRLQISLTMKDIQPFIKRELAV